MCQASSSARAPDSADLQGFRQSIGLLGGVGAGNAKRWSLLYFRLPAAACSPVEVASLVRSESRRDDRQSAALASLARDRRRGWDASRNSAGRELAPPERAAR
jgi:hypothetical protein